MSQTIHDTAVGGPVTVDFLYSDDCPSHERALRLVHEVIEQEGVEASINVYQVETEEDAERMAFPGSPTIRIAGSDIDEIDSAAFGLSCRAYRHADGKISPLPPKDKIQAAVRRVVAGDSRLSA